MRLKQSALLILILALILAACTSEDTGQVEPDGATATAPVVEQEQATAVSSTAVPASPENPSPTPTPTAVTGPPGTLPTAEAPTGTTLEIASDLMLLSHSEFGWQVALPASWIITYDAGFQLEAQSPDKSTFARVQAQRWETAEARLPDARTYVDHWKNFAYGDVFPLFANGEQLSETEVGQGKPGGPYLQYEFQDSQRGLYYMQLYASAGGPASAMVTVWTVEDGNEAVQEPMLAIINSFALVENSQ